jgi:amino acid transporter
MSSDVPATPGADPVLPAGEAATPLEHESAHPVKPASPASPEVDVAQLPDAAQRRRMNVLVVSSVALAFISFWRAAAIVLCDLASTAYYIGGISEQAIGKAAPWFILGVMLFSYAVRAVYVESCTMFTRGGVYRVVKGAVGGGVAKLSVSALMFDYILTGPISAVSAGQYMVGLFGDMLKLITKGPHQIIFDATTHPHPVNLLTVLLAIAITLYFWRANLKGMHESSDKALRIMQLTTVMGILIIVWSAITLAHHHDNLQAPPIHPVFTGDSEGWLAGFPRIVATLGIMVAFGHSLLAMSGEESLAQVNREIEAPKLKNLMRAGFVIFIYSMLLTSLISFLAVLIIPDGKRVATYIVPDGQEHTELTPQVDFLRGGDGAGQAWGYELTRTAEERPVPSDQRLDVGPGTGYHVERDNGGYRDNLINGLTQYLDGPHWLKIIMEAFVVIVGFLILAGAVNTSMVGSNGVLNRLAEDGVLTPWFQHPQRRYGTTHRLINLIAILQLVVIVASMGDVDTLGEAYAFGVIWSFVFMTLSMAVLRWHDRSPRAYRVPFNIRIPWGARTAPAGVHGLPVTATDSLGQAGARVSQAVAADGVAPKPAIRDIIPNGISDGHPADGKALSYTTQYPDYVDVPIGILTVFLILASTAMINLLTKKTATIWGLSFTAAFLIAFIILEAISHRRRKGVHFEHLEQFNERSSAEVTIESVGLKHPDPIIVAARGPRSLPVLEKVLRETDTDNRDVVVVTCKVLPRLTAGITPEETRVNDEDRELLTRIVTVAEEVGKEVHPVVLPTNNPLYAIATTARDLKAREVVLGVSEKLHAEEQLEQFALAWGSAIAELTGADPPLTVRILGPQVEMKYEMT